VALPAAFHSRRCLVPYEMATTNPPSSEVVFSGYRPIEVTADEFWKTIGDEGVNKTEKKKNSFQYRSMTRRIGGLLSSRKKKSLPNVDNDRSSLSGISNQGQQSVANKTIDSGTTIKASNLHLERSQKQTRSASISSTSQTTDCIEKRQQNALIDDNKQIRPTNTWKSLKRLVNKGRSTKHRSPSVTSQESSDANVRKLFQRRHAKSHDGAISLGLIPSSSLINIGYPMRKRIYSEGVGVLEQKQRQQKQRGGINSFSIGLESESRHAMDQAICGRLDGIDVLSLGPASRASLPTNKVFKTKICGDSARTSNSQAPQQCSIGDNDNGESQSFDPLHYSFTTLQSAVSPAKLVDEMIWTSGGMDQPEIILEGFYAGCNDRWSVRIPSSSSSSSLEEQMISNFSNASEKNSQSSSLQSPLDLNKASNSDDDSTAVSSSHTNSTVVDESLILPIGEVWNSLWGLLATPPPIPSHMNMQTIANIEKVADGHEEEYHLFNEEEEIQKLVETCNIPVDLDDDALIIDSPQHLQSFHELLMVPLQSRCFASVICIFEKLQRGLEGKRELDHLNASTNHNIGMIHLCRENYQEALEYFDKAVESRKKCLPSDHPDIAVSLQRKGMAHFALGSMGEALRCFEASLATCTPVDNTRAKILNNVGVARYQIEDYAQALKAFTSALEIQRPWLEGSVRRESTVYSASTILSNMGKVYVQKGDYDLAYFVFEEAYLMQTSIFRKDHHIVLCSLDNMARALAKNRNFTESLRIFTSLYRSQEARFGPNSEICIETVGMMGTAHFKLLEYAEAESCMKRVDAWQIKCGLDECHPSVQIKNEQISRIKRCLQGKEPMWV